MFSLLTKFCIYKSRFNDSQINALTSKVFLRTKT